LVDSIRSKARRAAWTTDGDAPNYNPFARTRSDDRRLDEESGLGLRSRSETHLEPTIEEQRQLESRQAGKEFPSLQHAGTAPPASASTEKPLLMAPGRRITDDENPQSPQGTRKESATTSDTLIGSQEGFRNRLAFKNPLRTFTEESERSTRSEGQKAALRRKIPIAFQMRALLFGTWINILLAVIPAGFAVYYTHRNPITVFCVNFIAIPCIAERVQ
jgi:Ca2+:H+ antiporter